VADSTTPLAALTMACGMPADLWAACESLKTLRSSPPEAWIRPWLAEFGLSELAHYIGNDAATLALGWAWLQIRGTPASVRMALTARGLVGAALEAEPAGTYHWHRYQIDPGAALESADTDATIGIAGVCSPVGVGLSRIYHDYDHRKLIVGRSPVGSRIGSDSGARHPSGVLVSFGTHAEFEAELAPTADMMSANRRHYVARYEDTFIVSASKIGATFARHIDVATSAGLSLVAAYEDLAWPDLICPDTTWGELGPQAEVYSL
jgi:hypothetical protein